MTPQARFERSSGRDAGRGRPVRGTERLKAVLFDLGGLFVHVRMERGFTELRRAFPSLTEAALTETCLAPDLLGAYEKGQMSTAGFHAEINRRLGVRIPFETFQSAWQNVFEPNPPMIRFLRGIPSRFRPFVLSNTNAMHVDFISSHFDILNRFAGHVYSHETGSAKPEREIFERALAVAGARPEECLFVDDLERNVRAAETLGIPSHHFRGNDAFFRFWKERTGITPREEN
jgi:HAD superfamily hydrolase (TIGR01509 family)